MSKVIEYFLYTMPQEADLQTAGNALTEQGYRWCGCLHLQDYIRTVLQGQPSGVIYALKPEHIMARPYIHFCKPGTGDTLHMEDAVESYPRPAGTGVLGYREIEKPDPVPA